MEFIAEGLKNRNYGLQLRTLDYPINDEPWSKVNFDCSILWSAWRFGATIRWDVLVYSDI